MNALSTFELILALLAVALVLPMIARRLPLPPAATLVLGGMALAAVPGTPAIELDPDLVMVLFLPPLLLSSAFFTVWRDFRAELRAISMLAIGAVVFTTLLVGWAAKLIVPGLPWAACFALGAIVSPPDAVAAKAVLHGLALPRRVVTILEGESLVNDASGLLLYRLAVAAALTGAFSWAKAGLQFIWLSVAGVGLGFIAGLGVAWALKRRKSSNEVILISLLTCWAVYILADRLQASSVLAVVTCGLVMGWRQHDVVTARSRTESRAVWRFSVSVLESLVFVLIGLSLRGVLNHFGGLPAAFAAAGPLALAVVGTVMVSRLLWVFPGIYLPRWLSASLRARDPAPPPGIAFVIGWAGMRGVVSLAAALALPNEFPGRDLLLFATFAVIAVTVLLQGSTLGLLIRWLVRPMAGGGRRERQTLGESAARTLVIEAVLARLQAMTREGQPQHPQLIDEFQRRLHIVTRVRDMEGSAELVERRRDHFDARLTALAVGRDTLIHLHRAGDIHDTVLHSIELELDLEELQSRKYAGESEDFD